MVALIDKPLFRVNNTADFSSSLFDGELGGDGSVYAHEHRDWLLGNAIPALTLPTGGERKGKVLLTLGWVLRLSI